MKARQRRCPVCGDSFTPHRRDQIHCSATCNRRQMPRACAICGRSFRPYRSNGVTCRRPSCVRTYDRRRSHKRYHAHAHRIHPNRRCPHCGKRLKKRANCYDPRCVAARERALEARLDSFVTAAERPANLCACGGNLTFGSDPMTGQTLEFCDNCGERETAVTGVRHHDQRHRLEVELLAVTERAAQPARPRRMRLFADPAWDDEEAA